MSLHCVAHVRAVMYCRKLGYIKGHRTPISFCSIREQMNSVPRFSCIYTVNSKNFVTNTFVLQVFHWAQKNAEHVVPLYCFDPRHYLGTHCFNFPKTGPFRLRFLLDSVNDLRASLKKKGR